MKINPKETKTLKTIKILETMISRNPTTYFAVTRLLLHSKRQTEVRKLIKRFGFDISSDCTHHSEREPEEQSEG
ncbi:hypothetical protein QJS04_geneDACA023847 [Acorus gramineus]|uniref:Uncharacterized protein n=1 Tax=Acorus gramineus TaxID=55184 RepID=A0AAV9BMF3_ACOGR|nr:hypothetical protein QJS04_geneDACA023847 [Acorus gramineus]